MRRIRNLLLILLVIILIFTLLTWFKSYSEKAKSTNNIDKILSDQFGTKYKLIHDNINNLNITIANSNTNPNIIENGIDPYDDKASPLVIVQDSQTKKVKSIYEIVFDRDRTKEFNTGNLIYPRKTEFKDVDGDQTKELVGEWSIYWGGSGGLVGMVIFKQEDDNLVPLTGYPSTLDTYDDISHMVITDRLSNRKFELPVIGGSQYAKLVDLNNDKKLEFLYATYDWRPEEDEGHFSPHYWDLQAFSLENNKFELAKWWNDGKPLKTTEKLGFEYSDESKITNTFQSKTTQK